MNELFNLKNKVIIVTGGNGLLGRKHVEAIAENEGIPIILDLKKNEQAKSFLNDYFKKFNNKVDFFECDITNENKVIHAKNKIIEKYGEINGLINNAAIDPKVSSVGIENQSRLEFFPIPQFELEVNVGLTGALICSKIFGYEMAIKKKGVIVNVASDLGVIAPNQNLYKKEGVSSDQQAVKPVTYSIIKHGLIGLTKYISTYWAQNGVRCNSLSPGGVFNGQSEEFVKKVSELIPIGRMANVDEYKGAITFLLSEASSYMNGSNLIIDGGRSSW